MRICIFPSQPQTSMHANALLEAVFFLFHRAIPDGFKHTRCYSCTVSDSRIGLLWRKEHEPNGSNASPGLSTIVHTRVAAQPSLLLCHKVTSRHTPAIRLLPRSAGRVSSI